jgi:transcriptional regulator with XRE-family HTH domain
MKTHRWEHVETELGLDSPASQAGFEEARIEYELGQRIRQLREEAGLSQRTLAKAVGTSQPMIVRLEGGGGVPRLDTLARVAAALGAELVVTLAKEPVQPVAYPTPLPAPRKAAARKAAPRKPAPRKAVSRSFEGLRAAAAKKRAPAHAATTTAATATVPARKAAPAKTTAKTTKAAGLPAKAAAKTTKAARLPAKAAAKTTKALKATATTTKAVPARRGNPTSR